MVGVAPEGDLVFTGGQAAHGVVAFCVGGVGAHEHVGGGVHGDLDAGDGRGSGVGAGDRTGDRAVGLGQDHVAVGGVGDGHGHTGDGAAGQVVGVAPEADLVFTGGQAAHGVVAFASVESVPMSTSARCAR